MLEILDKFFVQFVKFSTYKKVFIQKLCTYNLKEALKISTGLFGKILKILEKLLQKELIKYSKRFHEILGTVRKFLKHL